MAKYVLKNCGLVIGGYDLSDCHNSISLSTSCKTVDATVFGATSEAAAAGVKTVDMTATGYWDDTLGQYNDVGLLAIHRAQTNATIIMPTERTPVAAAPCTPTHMFKPMEVTYTPISGGMGEMRKFTTASKGWGDLYSGKLLHNSRVYANGDGTACNCGAIGAAQTLYAAMCVHHANFANLQVLVQSAPTQSFVAPTTRITFTTITSGVTSQWSSLGPGAITDAWWRVQWSFTGTAAGFTVAMAIL
jgi:hypothetical protein